MATLQYTHSSRNARNTVGMKVLRMTSWLAWAGGALALALTGAWIAEIVGHGLPAAVSRTIAILALLALLVAIGRVVWKAVRGGEGEETAALRILIVLVLLSIAVRFVGLDFEVVDHYFNDEGVFYAIGLEILQGQPLPDVFNYGHLLYYLSAFVLWLRNLFPGTAEWLAAVLYGLHGPKRVDVILLRSIAATLGALTTIPVFVMARRVAGLFAASVAGLLIVFSSVYNDVAHLVISDVPSGFFAALCLMFVARLLDGENLRDYLLAGIAAGLAAASKYPAGFAALGIVGIWVYWRIRERSWSWGVLWAGIAALAAFLAAMPGLLLRSDEAFVGRGLDILFGFRQYAHGGWIGAVKPSNFEWYGQVLLRNFGPPAVVLGLAGALFLPRESRRRWLALLPFPLLFLALILSMNMAVWRNLQPVIPVLAALLGAGIAGWPHLLERWRVGWGARLRPILAVVCLAAPVVWTTSWDIAHSRPGTRQLAVAWIEENVPFGATFVKEAYTPNLNSRRYAWMPGRFAGRLSLEQIRDPQWDYLMLAYPAYGRFLDPELWTEPQHEIIARRYQQMLVLPRVQEFWPGALRAGPLLQIFRLDPVPLEYATSRRWRATDAGFVSDKELMWPQEKGRGRIRYTRRGQSAVFKAYLEAGSYRLAVEAVGEPEERWVGVMTRDNREIGLYDLNQIETARLPAPDKYLFRVYLSPGAFLRAFEVTRIEVP